MLILALDTATEQGSLALAADDRLLAEKFFYSPGTYLQHLLPGVEELFQDAGRSLKELEAIAVSQGPGNFTGLRIGLATAKGLAWALDCPLVPVPTLAAIAGQGPHQDYPTAVLMDAKRGEVYLGLFRCPEEFPQTLAEPLRLPVAELPARLKPPLLLTGPGLSVYEDFLGPRHHPPPGPPASETRPDRLSAAADPHLPAPGVVTLWQSRGETRTVGPYTRPQSTPQSRFYCIKT